MTTPRSAPRLRPGELLTAGELLSMFLFTGLSTLVVILSAVMCSMSPIEGALTIAVPCALGVISGLLARSGGALAVFGWFWALIGCVVAVLIVGKLSGVFCGFVYTIVAFPPGMVCGLMVIAWRRWRRPRAPGRRQEAGLLLIAALSPWITHACERTWPTVHAPEHLAFVRDIPVPCARVWAQSLEFGPETSPWQFVCAPMPDAAVGRATAVGDEKTIRFAKGVVRVRIASVVPGRLVGEVVEQTIERRALGLHTVTVTCVPLSAQRTRVELRIDFEPRMGPRWYWRPFERFFGGITFDAVFSAWERAAAARDYGTMTAPAQFQRVSSTNGPGGTVSPLK